MNFTIATMNKYIEMGMKHVGNYEEVNGEKIRDQRIERILNGHRGAGG